MKAQIMASKMKKIPLFSRVLVTKSYDTLSFTYRNIGRFQFRFDKILDNGYPKVTVTGLLNHVNVFGPWQYHPTATIPLPDLQHMLDAYIDNVESLYNQATPIED